MLVVVGSFFWDLGVDSDAFFSAVGEVAACRVSLNVMRVLTCGSMHAGVAAVHAWVPVLRSTPCTASYDGTPRGYRAGCCALHSMWSVAPQVVATGGFILFLEGCILVGILCSLPVSTGAFLYPTCATVFLVFAAFLPALLQES